MSFLNELQQKKNKLKSCETIVTNLSGNKYSERRNDTGYSETKRLSETCSGYVVDEKLDLQIAEILNYLYLSSQDVAQDIDLLKKNGITHVLSIGVDLPTADSSQITFKKIELLDEPSADLEKVLPVCFEYIENSILENKNNKVLVHCNAGYSRAPTIVIAYLIEKYKYTLEKAINIVNEKRKVKPNQGFMKQLKMLEEKNNLIS